MIFLLVLFYIKLASSTPLVSSDELFEISVVHVNDFHARFAEVSSSGGNCNEGSECMGGFSRLYSQIQNLLDKNPKSILLNGGDNFQGTLYYSIGKWNITQEFMNLLPFDATVLGNHEFDDGVEGVVPFIKSLKTPVVCSNINDDEEPTMQGTYAKSVIIERNGKKIGIIGVIYSKTNTISNTGSLTFYPESASVNAEAERLVAEEGVFTNIVLSHVGYDIDKEIAANASEKIGLIVGAHSHTFLYSGDNPPGPDTPKGPYPTIVKSKYDKDVLIVQASCYSKYLGNITLYYNSDGEVTNYSGAPIFMEESFPKDSIIDEALQPWDDIVDAEGSVVIGSSLVTLSAEECYVEECTLGNFVTDAYVFAYSQISNSSWTKASIALVNSGGLRSNILIGNLTYSDMATAQPFSNTVDYAELEGRYLKQALEVSADSFNNQRISSDLGLLQVSGIHVVYNLSNPVGERVVDVKVRCQMCDIPVYEKLDLDTIYSITIPSFITGGGDGYLAISENLRNIVTGQLDMDVFKDYLTHKSPIFVEEEGRITVITDHEIYVNGSK